MCDYPRCRQKAGSDGVVYHGKDLCGRCWARACARNEDLKATLKIKKPKYDYPSVVEDINRDEAIGLKKWLR